MIGTVASKLETRFLSRNRVSDFLCFLRVLSTHAFRSLAGSQFCVACVPVLRFSLHKPLFSFACADQAAVGSGTPFVAPETGTYSFYGHPFYENRAGKNLSAAGHRKIAKTKAELRKLFAKSGQ